VDSTTEPTPAEDKVGVPRDVGDYQTGVSAAPKPAWKFWLGAVVRWAILAALLLFLGRTLIDNYQKVCEQGERPEVNWVLMIVALAGHTAGHYGFGVAWQRGLSALGGRVRLTTSVWLWSWTNLAKYLPVPGGKLVVPPIRAAAFATEGVSGALTICGLALESVCCILTGFAVFAITLPFQAFTSEADSKYSWLCLLILPLLVLLHPRVFNGLTWVVLKVFRQEKAQFRLSLRDQVVVLGYWLVGWALMAGSFALLTASVTNLPLARAPLIAATFAFAWVLSMVSFITPAGIGVREIILGALLVPQVGPIGGLLAGGSRLFTTAADGLSILVAFTADQVARIVRGPRTAR